MKPRCSFPISLLTALVFAPGSAAARTLTVPDPFPTIQTAIDSAAAGDSVLVSPGTYVENLHTDGKELTLKSLGSPENTIIDGNQQGSVIWVTADAHIEGFTIQNGKNQNGGGILVEGHSQSYITVSIVGNSFVGNRAGDVVDSGNGGGMYLSRVIGSKLEGNVLKGNYAGDSGGGVAFDLSEDNVIIENVFVDNGCHVCGGAVRSSPGVEIGENLIYENWSDSFGAGICGSADLIFQNTIASNYTHNAVAALGAGIEMNFGAPVIERNIVVDNHGPSGAGTGVGIACGSLIGPVTLQCNDVWGNDINYLVRAGCDTTNGNNISVDPLFCDPENGNYSLQAGSPCSEEANPTCGQIGAFGVACPGTSVERATWGRLKQMFDEKN